MGPLVVLAYSGGLDTSAIVPWLREQYGARVMCFAADVGQGAGELKGLVEKAKRSGATDCVIEDLREEFVRDFAFRTLRAGAVYARTYLLGTAMARPVTAAHQVALAQRIGAQAVAHGCTGKGNDQVRFELTYAALAPELQVIAPWREWTFRGREELIETLNDVAAEHGVGRADVVEDRLVGMKSRGVYETPGGTLLYAAHRELEQLVLDRRTLRLKDEVALRYADVVYDGRWWTPEREALDALVTSTQQRVTGTVGLKLYKGSVTVAGRESPHALYQPSYATFGKDNVYNQKDAEGFIHLYGLAIKIGAGLDAVRREQDAVAAAD